MRVFRRTRMRSLTVGRMIRVYRNWPKALRRTILHTESTGDTVYYLRNGTVFQVQDTLSDVAMITEIWADLAYLPSKDFVVKPEWTVVDGGANKGIYTVFAAARSLAATVYAIEPHPSNFAYLQSNILRNNLSNVICLPLALAGESGAVELSISSQADAHFTTPRHSSKFTGQYLKVESISLNDLIQKHTGAIDLLKLDIEGAEEEVLRHLSSSSWSFIRRIILEPHETIESSRSQSITDIRLLLKEHGFVTGVTDDRFPLLWGVMPEVGAV